MHTVCLLISALHTRTSSPNLTIWGKVLDVFLIFMPSLLPGNVWVVLGSGDYGPVALRKYYSPKHLLHDPCVIAKEMVEEAQVLDIVLGAGGTDILLSNGFCLLLCSMYFIGQRHRVVVGEQWWSLLVCKSSSCPFEQTLIFLSLLEMFIGF